MKILKRVHFYAIFKDIMHCFITSCGFVSLLFFYTNTQFEKELFRQSTLCIFMTVMFMLIINEILTKGQHWFYDTDIIVASINNDINELPIAEIETKNQKIAEHNRRITSVHEAGHALMSYIKQIETFDVRMSYISPKIVTVYKQADANGIKDFILIYYAGAAAEEILLGQIHAGSAGTPESDFERATELIKSYITMTNQDVSKSLLSEELAPYIISYSKEFYKEAKDILHNNKDSLEILAKELMVKDILNKDDLNNLFRV